METWPDLIQHFGQPLLFSGFKVKQALLLQSPFQTLDGPHNYLDGVGATRAYRGTCEGEGIVGRLEDWVSTVRGGVFHGTLIP